ncbi:MAG TPA: acyl-CoA dehydrogenase family protein [Candidatus Xenobia bacterium]|jgi:alkylation response protein AidB-like acyl-CoA dehydrogenase
MLQQATPKFPELPPLDGPRIGVLTRGHEAFQDELQAFVRAEVAPIAADFEGRSEYPLALLKRMGELGYLGIMFSKEYGGRGLDGLCYAMAVEEFSRWWGSLGITVAAHSSLGSGPLYYYGREELKREYLPLLTRCEIIGAYGLTEPQAGSDSGATATRARKVGKEWVLNGTKCFCTNASYARTYTVTAVTGEENGKKQISAFFLDREKMPGITISKKEDKMGLRASDTCTVVLQDVKVPEAHMLGEEGQGFKIFMQTLDGGRITIGSMALGLGQGALDEAVLWVNQQEGGFKSILDDQLTLEALSVMRTELQAGRLLLYDAAVRRDARLPYTEFSSMAKFFASEAAVRACNAAIEVMGEAGLREGTRVVRAYRDIKLCTIGEGTTEVQKLVIAREMLRQQTQLPGSKT